MSSPSASHKGAWEHVTEERDLSNLATQRTSADSACDDESAAKDEEEISIGTRSSTPHSDCSDSHLSTETELKRPVIVDDSDDENKENTGSFQVNPDIALELEEMQLFELADIQSALVVGRSLSPIALPDPDTSGVHMELLVEEGEEKTEVMNEEDGRIFHESEPMEENLHSPTGPENTSLLDTENQSHHADLTPEVSAAPSPMENLAEVEGDRDMFSRVISSEEDEADGVENTDMLDESIEEDAPVTVEAREERLLERYNKALRVLRIISVKLQSSGLTRGLHRKIADLRIKFDLVLEELPQMNEEDDQSTIGDNRMKALKFAVLKNMAHLYHLEKDYRNGLDYLMAAAEIDYTDVVMIYDMGTLAVKLENFPLAASFFQDALRIRSNHWPSLDAMITLMYALNYFPTCLQYCCAALRMEQSHQRALAFIQKIFEEHDLFEEEWMPVLQGISRFVSKPLSPSSGRFIDEASDVKKRWWKDENKPSMELKRIGFPVLQRYSFVGMGESLLSYQQYLDASKLWNAVLIVSTEEPMETDHIDGEGEFSADGARNVDTLLSFPPFDEENSSSRPTAAAKSPSKSRKPDPVFLLFADKRRSARSPESLVMNLRAPKFPAKYFHHEMARIRFDEAGRLIHAIPELRKIKESGRNDEAFIRHFLRNFSEQVFGCVPELFPNDILSRSASSSPTKSDKISDTPALLSWDSLEETEEVRQMLTAGNEKRIPVFIRQFLQFFAEHTDRRWPSSMISIFVDLYYVIAHEEFFPPYETYEASRLERTTRRIILLSLCALEIIVDHWMQFGAIGTLPRNFRQDLDYIAVWPNTDEFPDNRDLPMHLRILFVLYKWHTLRNSVDQAEHFLQEIDKRITEDTVVQLPNLSLQNIIKKDTVVQLLSGKRTIGRLSEFESLFQANRFEEVVGIMFDLMKKSKGLEVDEQFAFTPFHIKSTFSALQQLNRWKDYLIFGEYCIRNILLQYNDSVDEKDEERRGCLKGSMLEISDEILREKTRSPVRMDWSPLLNTPLGNEGAIFCRVDLGAVKSIGNLPLETVKNWTASLIELCIILVHARDGSTVRPITLSPFILIYYLLTASGEEFKNVEDDAKRGDISIHYLEEVHEYLGGHEWCTAAGGSFLHLAIERLSEELVLRMEDEGVSDIPTADIEYDMEQCFYCLYGLTKNKNRYLQNHSALQTEISLQRAVPLYKFYEPSTLPEFDGYRNDCISQETVNVLTKIRPVIANIPYVISRDDIHTFIRKFDSMTDVPELPHVVAATKENNPEFVICKNLFYLLADFYYKGGENTRALRLYLSDLCINPGRYDSWAGLALNKGALVEEKLRSFELKPNQKTFEEGMEAVACFGIALKINPTSEHLWIECLNLVYPLHSYLSRQLVQSVQLRLKANRKAELKLHRDYLLRLSEKACLHAEDCAERHETWLSQYMLGKTLEKLARNEPWRYLSQYTAAAKCLHFDKASYPVKITYYKTPRLAVEALEMFYRIFASSLKFLCRSRRSDHSDLKAFQAVQYHIDKAEKGPFARNAEYGKKGREQPVDEEMYVAKRVVDSDLLEPLEFVEFSRQDMEQWKLELVHRCIKGLQICLTRYPEHYKSLYRLAKLYYEFAPLKDLQKTKDLLLGSAISWQERPYMPCAGLFQHRKHSNFFKGVWHIKSEEIQRQLSFPSHMYRSLSLLINVLADLRENLQLLQIFQFLAKPPDALNKRFLRVDDYYFLAEFAMKSALLAVMNRVEDYENDSCSSDVRIAFLKEVLKVWQTAKKENLSAKNVTLANAMLAHAYLRLVGGVHKSHCPIPTPQDVVDKAVKYIQHVQFRPHVQPTKPIVKINLSTGLPDDVELSSEIADSSQESSSDPQKVASKVDISAEAEENLDEVDLMGIDFNPCPINFDFDLEAIDENLAKDGETSFEF